MEKTYTTELTSKKYKKQILMAMATFIVGIVFVFLGAQGGHDTMFGSLITLGGLVWYIKTKCQIWWNHD